MYNLSMNYRVIQTGGKQYLVFPGAVVTVEKLPGNLTAGAEVLFDKVLLTDDGITTQLGAPYLEGVEVRGKVLEAGRARKITVVKFKPKTRYRKKAGHRQEYLKVQIADW